MIEDSFLNSKIDLKFKKYEIINFKIFCLYLIKNSTIAETSFVQWGAHLIKDMKWENNKRSNVEW